MEEKTETYHAMYDAPIVIQPPTEEEPYGDNDAAFYRDDIAFVIESPPKNAQDRPIVLIRIPAELIDPALAAGKTSGIGKTDRIDPGRNQRITKGIRNFRTDQRDHIENSQIGIRED